MEILQEGQGQLVGWHDPDENRQWILENKPRELVDKRMTVAEAVERYVHDGDFLASGGFGHVRVTMAAIYEIIRQGQRHLIMAGKTARAGCRPADRLRLRRPHRSGVCLRARAARPFTRLAPQGGRRGMPGAGRDLQRRLPVALPGGHDGRAVYAGAQHARAPTPSSTAPPRSWDPWSGKPMCLLPACYPDVALIHVSRCDLYGNAQIDGTMIEDFELARAARRLILTAEEIIPEGRSAASRGAPSSPSSWWTRWWKRPTARTPARCRTATTSTRSTSVDGELEDPEGVDAYFQKYVFGVADFTSTWS